MEKTQDVENFILALRKHPDILKCSISLLRSKADPLYFPEKLGGADQDREIEKMISLLDAEKPEEAEILRFFLRFVQAVKKTDYFDTNRLRELFSFVLDISLLGEYTSVPKDQDYLPSEVVCVYKPRGGLSIVPIYPDEKRLSGERYAHPSDASRMQDPLLLAVLKTQAPIFRENFMKQAGQILSITAPDNHTLALLRGIRFVKDDGKSFDLQNLHSDSYFSLAARALFAPTVNDGLPHEEELYLYDIARRFQRRPEDINAVRVSFLGRGVFKNVAHVTVNEPEKPKSFQFCIGIELPERAQQGSRMCEEEFAALRDFSGQSDLIPAPYGFIKLETAALRQSVIFREFLAGSDAMRYFNKLVKPLKKERFFKTIGSALGKLYAATGMGSADYKLENIIFLSPRGRFCDIAPFTDDLGEVRQGFKQIVNQVPLQFVPHFLSGISEIGKEGVEFMARIRFNLLVDRNDGWMADSVLKHLDNFAQSLGKDPDQFYELI
jgi:hypothetical protein